MTRVSIPTDIAERAQGFVGRLWVLNEVMDWVDHGNERYLLITGGPGSGKTALAAWLTGGGPRPLDKDANSDLERVRDLWGAVHFCVGRGRSGTLTPARFAQSLAHQLSDRYDDYAEAVLQRINPEMNIHLEVRENWGSVIGAQIGTLIVNADAEDVYNRVVREPLEVLSNNQPDLRVFILVDALDEALLYGLTNIVTLLAGSDDLPTGMRFLLTSRNDSRVTDQFQKMRSLDLSSPAYGPNSNGDIRIYVQKRMSEDSIKEHMGVVGSPAEVEEHLVKHAAGNFLYIKFLLDEVVDGKRSLANIVDFPMELYGLYRVYLDRLLPESLQIGGSSIWVKVYQPLLGVLSVAQESLTFVQLQAFTGLSKRELVIGLNQLGQLLEELGQGKEEMSYRLYHQSIIDFFHIDEYWDNKVSQLNRYYLPEDEWHKAIVDCYLKRLGITH